MIRRFFHEQFITAHGHNTGKEAECPQQKQRTQKAMSLTGSVVFSYIKTDY